MPTIILPSSEQPLTVNQSALESTSASKISSTEKQKMINYN